MQIALSPALDKFFGPPYIGPHLARPDKIGRTVDAIKENEAWVTLAWTEFKKALPNIAERTEADKPFLKDEEIDEATVKALVAANAVIAEEIESPPPRREWVRTGVALVLAGFFLQFIGAWPSL